MEPNSTNVFIAQRERRGFQRPLESINISPRWGEEDAGVVSSPRSGEEDARRVNGHATATFGLPFIPIAIPSPRSYQRRRRSL